MPSEKPRASGYQYFFHRVITLKYSPRSQMAGPTWIQRTYSLIRYIKDFTQPQIIFQELWLPASRIPVLLIWRWINGPVILNHCFPIVPTIPPDCAAARVLRATIPAGTVTATHADHFRGAAPYGGYSSNNGQTSGALKRKTRKSLF